MVDLSPDGDSLGGVGSGRDVHGGVFFSGKLLRCPRLFSKNMGSEGDTIDG